MPPRRRGSGRRTIGFGELLRLQLGPRHGAPPQNWGPLLDRDDSAEADWRERDRVLRLDRRRIGSSSAEPDMSLPSIS